MMTATHGVIGAHAKQSGGGNIAMTVEGTLNADISIQWTGDIGDVVSLDTGDGNVTNTTLVSTTLTSTFPVLGTVIVNATGNFTGMSFGSFSAARNVTSVDVTEANLSNIKDFLYKQLLLTSLRFENSGTLTDASQMVRDCTNLTCISKLKTTASTNTTGMFTNTPALTAPNSTEQTALLSGSTYVNASPCP